MATTAAPVASAAEEVAALDKVLLRLGLTDEDKLEKVSCGTVGSWLGVLTLCMATLYALL